MATKALQCAAGGSSILTNAPGSLAGASGGAETGLLITD